MKTALPITIGLLLISLFLNWQQWQSAKENDDVTKRDSKLLHEAIDKHLATAKTAARRADSIEAKRIRDSLSYKSRLMASNEEIRAYRKTIERLRPLVQAKIDSFPDLREFVAAQDSTIDSQALTIRDQEIFCQAQVRDLKEIIALTNEQLAAQKEITAAVTEQLALSDKQTRKERKGKRFWQIVGGVLAAGIIYQSVR